MRRPESRDWPRRRGGGCLTLAVAALSLVTGCASPGPSPEEFDPHESANRKVYGFNEDVDTYVLEPASKGYTRVAPAPVEAGVSNFFDNLAYPNVIVNDFLQGKVQQGTADTGRFLINTTIGMAGLFDPATDMGLAEHNEDFGQTLAVWGSGSGSYLTIPLLGPSSGRDVWGIPVSWLLNPVFYAEASVSVPLTVLQAIDLRARAEGVFQFRDAVAVDPYAFTRDAYLQHRTHVIHDGNPPLPDYDALEGALDEPAPDTEDEPSQP